MSKRFNHKVVEVKPTLFSGKLTQNVQAEMDKMSAQGWELVAVNQTNAADVVRLYYKKEH